MSPREVLRRTRANRTHKTHFVIPPLPPKPNQEKSCRLPDGTQFTAIYDGATSMWHVMATDGTKTFQAAEHSIHWAVLKAGRRLAGSLSQHDELFTD